MPLLQLVLQYSVDGLIVSAGSISKTITERCRKRNIPLVAFARRPKSSNLNVVCADNVAGGRLAAKQFIDTGHQKISLLAGPETASTSLDRSSGFTDLLTESGLPLHSKIHAATHSRDETIIELIKSTRRCFDPVTTLNPDVLI